MLFKRKQKVRKDNICPECGTAKYVVPIAYGLPGEEMFRRAEKGKIALGGCCINIGVSPIWYCRKHDLSFGILDEEAMKNGDF